MENDNKPDKVIQDALKTHNTVEGMYSFDGWLGAVFYHTLKLGKVSFQEVYNEKNRSRNVWTGWLLKIVLIVLGLWAIIFVAG